jgi:hypothetical protein
MVKSLLKLAIALLIVSYGPKINASTFIYLPLKCLEKCFEKHKMFGKTKCLEKDKMFGKTQNIWRNTKCLEKHKIFG